MRRTIISTLLMLITLGINAQLNSPVDSLFKRMKQEHLPISHMRWNSGNGLITDSYSIGTSFSELCLSTCPTPLAFSSDESKEKTNRENKKKTDRIMNILRQEVDKLMPLAEESYHFESHKKTGDTITYSLCLKYSDDDDDEIKKEIAPYNGQYYFGDAIETLSLEYYAQPNNGCSKHKSAWGALNYFRNEQLPSGETLPFDWEAYHALILPLLNQDGVIAREFRWAQDNDPEYGKKLNIDYRGRYQVHSANGKTTEGEATGIIYTIPYDKQDLAIALLDSINSITERFLDEHREQNYSYLYGESFKHYKKGFKGDNYCHMFSTMIDGELVSCRKVEIANNEDGHHILVFKARGAVWVPREYSKLKSMINGVKEYY